MNLVICIEQAGEGISGFNEGFCGLEEVDVDFIPELGWEGEEAKGSR